MAYFINQLPLWVIFIATIAASLVAIEMGYRLAQQVLKGEKKGGDGDAGGIVATLFGLLAFILAISFSITANRLDTRKQLVLDEANAVSDAYLRAKLLPQPQGVAARELLTEYVDIRVKIAANNANMAAMITRSEEIHGLLWAQAESLVSENMDSEIRSLFIGSLNDIINLHQRRKTVAFIYRIPTFIWSSLFLLMFVSMFGAGFQIGAAGKKRSIAHPLMVAAFTLVIIMIAAMDRADSVSLVSQQPIIELLEMMQKAH